MRVECRVLWQKGRGKPVLRIPLVLVVLGLSGLANTADIPEEFKVKRQEVFELVQKPTVTREGDKVTIAFASRGYCDATVAVEDAQGKIVRHLVSGVLGPKAPAPLQANSLKQVVIWDGKNDKGEYVDDKDSVVVRVSLGLKPQFERTLFWHPLKPNWSQSPIVCPAPEGVYVYQGGACDQLRLFDHDGSYVRTIYPFPADKVGLVKGLRTHTFPQDGRTLPLKGGFMQTTLLTSGPNSEGYTDKGAATAIAVHENTIALLHKRSNWLGADGSSGGRILQGQQTGLMSKVLYGNSDWKDELVPPRSAALSPDGRWLYATGYAWVNGWIGNGHVWGHVVMRVSTDGPSEPEVFAGSDKDKEPGAGDTRFNVPTSVACDALGRVYVSDFWNHRIQVFSEDKRLLKSISVKYPAHVSVHQKTGHIYVFSWMICSIQPHEKYPDNLEGALTHLGPFERPEPVASYRLPRVDVKVDPSWDTRGGKQYRIALDSRTDPPRIWLSKAETDWDQTGPVLLEEKDGRLELKRDFRQDVKRAVVRTKPPILWRQRLYVNPAAGLLYVGEGDSGVMKSFRQLVELNAETGKVRLVDLPFDAEDMCIDLDGVFYLRTDTEVARFDPKTWREIPWDYGEDRTQGVSFGGWDGKSAPVIAALILPGHRPGCFHEGGMWISQKGHLAVTCYNSTEKVKKIVNDRVVFEASGGGKYTPVLYPGRLRGLDIHVWDKHGKLVGEDVVPGLAESHGIGIDKDDAIHILAAPTRVLDGQRYFDKQSCTLIKFRPKKGKFISPSGAPVPLTDETRPRRSVDLEGNGGGWAEGADWFYGGVGWTGFNGGDVGGWCSCWNCRPAFDYFGRSFAPETRHFSVAVLDASGNLILRIGQYGNVEDGKPLVADGGPPNVRSIGGDEVALVHAAYLGTHSDRRLFIADAGNARILSVKFGYHAEEKIALKDVKDTKKPE